ncbi:glycosyltransferase [Serinicoccus chungangensis]|uniref:glycosyltransferase n=1 Tax=Serinicoccus chungangensis TaxID=767452 RepID=UPI0013053104|nr:glycosyltransferase [Serinicoccus chungangensis]
MTLLDLGAQVTVVNTPPREDFFLGLSSPRLSATFVEVRSAAMRYQMWMTRQNTLRRARWDQEAQLRRERAGKPRPVAPAWMLTGGRVATLAYGWWTSRRGRRIRTLATKRWPIFKRWWIRRGRAARKQRDLTVRNALRQFHTLNRFVDFWRLTPSVIEAHSPDLIVSSDLPGLVGASIAARRMRRPHLHDCHELYLESTAFRPHERALLWPVERHYMRRADSIVVVNTTIRDEYRRRYGVDGVVLRNCSPPVPTSVRQRPMDLNAMLGLDADKRIVLYQGGLVAGRGLDVCVRAVSHFPDDAHLVLLGNGALREELLALATQLGVRARVHDLPAVPPAQLPSWTAAASVGLIPYQPVSKNNMYALPNKAFEYPNSGVPFVASRLPEIARLVDAWRCGETYDSFDEIELSNAVHRVLDSRFHAAYRERALHFAAMNSWHAERRILVAEIERLTCRP